MSKHMTGVPLFRILEECWRNRYRLWRLSSYDVKVRNSETVFGFLWNFFNPALQIFVYWFVFAIGLRTPAPVEGYSYLIWMIFGIMPWFFINSAIMSSTTSIVAFRSVLKRMKFPVGIVPAKAVLSAFIEHLWAMVVVIALFFLCGYRMGVHAVNLLYFMVCALAFLLGFGLFASAVNVVFRDFQKIMNSILRLLFYLSPVVWSQDSLPEHLKFALRLNPIAYIIDGYRESILYNHTLMFHGRQAVYFWCVTILLLLVGAAVHDRLCRQFMDLV